MKHEPIDRTNLICWSLYVIAVLTWLYGYYQAFDDNKRHLITLSVIFLVGALTISALKHRLQPKETT